MTDTREADAIEGWLAYGAALNEGRALFAGDAEFGKWVAENSLRQVGGADIHDHERAAAMWAAANADQLAEASPQQMHPAARKQEPRRSLLVQAPGAWAANGFGSNPHWLSSQGGGIEAAQEGVFRTKEPRCEGDRNRGGEIGA